MLHVKSGNLKSYWVLATITGILGFVVSLYFAQIAFNQNSVEKNRLEGFVRSYDLIQLDASSFVGDADRPKHLSIVTSEETFRVTLVRRDLRSARYKAEEVGLDGSTSPVPRDSIVNTYKGSVDGIPDAEARFTINQSKLEGTISIGYERYFVEPFLNFNKSANPNDYVIYKASEIIGNEASWCGVETLSHKIDVATELISTQNENLPRATTDNLVDGAVIEIATEADFEFTTAEGGSIQANNQILGILNQVEGIYETELGITLSVVYQHTWATSNDPYNTSDPTAALSEFRNYWNSNYAGILRDTAHMWTGRQIFVAGVANVGVICTPSFSYEPVSKVVELRFSILVRQG